MTLDEGKTGDKKSMLSGMPKTIIATETVRRPQSDG